jgi:hypothetical protein
LRSALSQVLDFGTQRSIVAGKLFDLRLTVVATLLITGYLALTAYVAIATRAACSCSCVSGSVAK